MPVIKMSSKDVEQLVYDNGGTDFDLVEEDISHEDAYKNMAPVDWIFKRLSDDTYWRATGSVNTGHYSDNPTEYDDDLQQVEPRERVTVVKTWEAV